MPIHDNADDLPTIAIGAEILEQFSLTEEGVPRIYSGSCVAVDLDASGTRELRIWGHPALGILPPPLVQDHNHSLMAEVIVGNIANVIWEVRDRTEDGTHLLHRLVGDVNADPELVSLGRSVKTVATATFTTGVYSRSRTYQIPMGTYHTTHVIGGPAAEVLTRVAPAVPPPRGPKIAVPMGLDPRSCTPRNSRSLALLWGIVQTTYPDWRNLVK